MPFRLIPPLNNLVGVTIRNAHAKGPDHVVDYAIRQRRNAAYDRMAVLLDTERDDVAELARLLDYLSFSD